MASDDKIRGAVGSVNNGDGQILLPKPGRRGGEEEDISAVLDVEARAQAQLNEGPAIGGCRVVALAGAGAGAGGCIRELSRMPEKMRSVSCSKSCIVLSMFRGESKDAKPSS